MSERNLNPHAEARVAMALWSDRYSKQKLGCMDFYDGLTAAQKSTCAQIVDGIIYADRADGRTRPPSPNVVGGDQRVRGAIEVAAKIAEEDRTPAYGPHKNDMEWLAETQRKSIAERIRAALAYALNVNGNTQGSDGETPATCCRNDPNDVPKREHPSARRACDGVAADLNCPERRHSNHRANHARTGIRL